LLGPLAKSLLLPGRNAQFAEQDSLDFVYETGKGSAENTRTGRAGRVLSALHIFSGMSAAHFLKT